MRTSFLIVFVLVLTAGDAIAQAEPVYEGDSEDIETILAQSRRLS
jgi:hypothetical protein